MYFIKIILNECKYVKKNNLMKTFIVISFLKPSKIIKIIKLKIKSQREKRWYLVNNNIQVDKDGAMTQ